jgi:hypothetical protein
MPPPPQPTGFRKCFNSYSIYIQTIMVKTADIGSNRLLSLAPDAWVQWVTQRPDV